LDFSGDLSMATTVKFETEEKRMGPTRFERVTSRLSAVRSTWLSYGPGPHFALMIPLITVSLSDSRVESLAQRCAHLPAALQGPTSAR
jgi:hypothetical protein